MFYPDAQIPTTRSEKKMKLMGFFCILTNKKFETVRVIYNINALLFAINSTAA